MKHPFSIRRCAEADADLLALVGGATFLESYANVLDGPDILAHCMRHHSRAAYDQYLHDPTSRSYVAELIPNNSAVGYITLCEAELPVEDLSPDDYELKRIYLLHRFQGAGIGRALMEQAVAAAREMGRTRLLLGVYGKNEAALHFYTKAGFRKVGERFFTVGSQTHHDFVLGREI